jgi:hypothetical protein
LLSFGIVDVRDVVDLHVDARHCEAAERSVSNEDAVVATAESLARLGLLRNSRKAA